MRCKPCSAFPSGVKLAGTVIDHPDAFWLVRMGCAEAVDDECTAAADMTPEAWRKAHHAYPRMAAGVHPEDFAAWDSGRMRGYNPDGTFVPGPNVDQQEDYDLMEDDEDE